MVYHFVDGTNVSYANKYITNINEKLKQLVNWSSASKLSLNISKTLKANFLYSIQQYH